MCGSCVEEQFASLQTWDIFSEIFCINLNLMITCRQAASTFEALRDFVSYEEAINHEWLNPNYDLDSKATQHVLKVVDVMDDLV